MVLVEFRAGRPNEYRLQLADGIVDACVDVLGVPRKWVLVEFTPHKGEEIYRDGKWVADWSARRSRFRLRRAERAAHALRADYLGYAFGATCTAARPTASPDSVRGFPVAREWRLAYSGLPIDTFSVPTPSTPHSSLSPRLLLQETPAGVPVMMMSSAASFTCCESCQMISGTFQINLGEVALLGFLAVDGEPDLAGGRVANLGGRSGSPSRAPNSRTTCRSPTGAPSCARRSAGRGGSGRCRRRSRRRGSSALSAGMFRPPLFIATISFDLVMQILGQRRIGDGGAVGHQHVGVLGKEERRGALVVAHLPDMLEIVAPDAPDAAHRIDAGLSDDGEREACCGKRNDGGGGVHRTGLGGLKEGERPVFTRLRPSGLPGVLGARPAQM